MNVRTLVAAAVAAAVVVAPFPAHAAGDPLKGARVVPIPTAGPSWYDMDFHRRVIETGYAPLPPTADPAAFGLVLPGIRPGQWLISAGSNGVAWCSANFVFRKSSTYGLGTAGHCAAKDALGAFPDVTAYVMPPPGQGLPGIYHIGKFALVHNNDIGDDFAMVGVYPQFNAWMDPTMPVWGGPIGVYTANTPTVVEHFGHGAVVGTGGTPRAGAAPIWTARGGTAFAWYGAGAPGDSGSGVRVVTGEAAGNFTHIVIYDGSRRSPIGEILPGMVAGTRMTKILQIANGWTMQNGRLAGVP
jgi:hypothetical protein